MSVLSAQYQGPLDSSAPIGEFADIVTGDAESGYVYHFEDGDEIVAENLTTRNYVVGGQWGTNLTISGDVTIRGSRTDDAYIFTLYGIYGWVGSEEDLYKIQTDNVSINVEATGALTNGNQWVITSGVTNTWGASVAQGTVNVRAVSTGDNAYVATAQGLLTQNGGEITVNGGTIEVVATNDGYASQAFGISTQGHNVRNDHITSTDALKIIAHAENTSSMDSTAFSYAYGVIADNGDPVGVYVYLADLSVEATATADAGTAGAAGIYAGNAGEVIAGDGAIYAEASSESGAGLAYGLYSASGAKKLVKGAGDITVKGSFLAAGIYAGDGDVSYGGGNISVSMTSEEITPNATGIYAGTNAEVSLLGNTNVEAESALVGSGTVIVEKSVSTGFDGAYNQFAGDMLVRGFSGLGMSEEEAARYTTDDDVAALVLYAGSTLDGRYKVGSDAQKDGSTASGSSLDLLSDGTLVIVANADYDGKSSLVTVDSASAETGSVLRLVNSARVDEGTTVFDLADGTEAPQGYTVETDSLFTEVVDNQIRRKSVESVFGDSILLPNVVEEALAGTTGEGADRIFAVTSDAYTPTTSAKALNKIALMGAAGGAQIAASNAVLMVDESLMRHGSKLVSYGHEAGHTDLWIDLNGSFSRAHDFSAGSTNFGYKSDLAGGTFGADYVFGNGLVGGAALSFGTGSVRGQDNAAGTKNDVDYWGLSVYGAWDAGVVNVIGSVGWLQTKNEISQNGFTGEPDVSALTLSARVEKPFELGAGYSMTPHVGVRWTRLDADDFTAGGFRYESEKVDLFSFPIGVAFSKAFATSGGAQWKSFLDLEVAPTAGDRKANNTVGLEAGAVEDAFDARISSNVVYSARVGLSGRIGKSHDVGLYYGVSAGNGEFVAQHLKASYRFAF